ncbi:hypothetical protein ACWCQL_30110 [Streptomyces sp. NPDC002073]
MVAAEVVPPAEISSSPAARAVTNDILVFVFILGITSGLPFRACGYVGEDEERMSVDLGIGS